MFCDIVLNVANFHINKIAVLVVFTCLIIIIFRLVIFVGTA